MHPIKVPKSKRLTPEKVQRVVTRNLKTAVEHARSDMQKPTENWSADNQPTFVVKFDKNGAQVTTDSTIYHWLDAGTKPHQITIVNAPRLIFKTDYVSKTVPRFLGTRTGGASGPTVGAITVNHPGISAREWTVVIAEQRGKEFAASIRADLKRIV